jgi:tRNA threonylcarbamoyladenosine biosynthesis protein TsaE
MAFRLVSKGEQDTERLAEALAAMLRQGTVLALDGDLGAGKTRFSQALAKALGVRGVVNSPTFTIIKEYAGEELPFYHMDVYRISMAEADELGLDEYFYGEGVSVVEWASLIEELLPQQRLDIYIANLGDTTREFTLTPHGEPYTGWCETLNKNGWLS